eukprot:TRINITY_DN332_c0_g1_i19.p1 TRINITY_DN332_c0_g1~~TRINITY_DN332_c0_g1_i19.p1  ORF type:complete len:148 (-),score=25.08 TRINITY_DN332_c0_g1_i19:71-514(-)
MKVELCSFSGLKIYPGVGSRFVRQDSKIFYFRTSKDAAYFHQKQKPAKFRWTTVYRKLNKKGSAEARARRRKRVGKKIQRPVAGMDMELLKKIRKENPERRKERLAANEAEIRARRAKLTAQRPKGGSAPQQAARGPKARGTGNKGR